MSEFIESKVEKLIKHDPMLTKIWGGQTATVRANKSVALRALYNAVIVKTPALITLYNRTKA